MDVEFNDYTGLSQQEMNTVLDSFRNSLGIDYDAFTAKLSEVGNFEKFYSLSSRGNNSDQYQVHDYIFEYLTENNGQIRIALCSYEKPLRDWFVDTRSDSRNRQSFERIKALLLTGSTP